MAESCEALDLVFFLRTPRNFAELREITRARARTRAFPLPPPPPFLLFFLTRAILTRDDSLIIMHMCTW